MIVLEHEIFPHVRIMLRPASECHQYHYRHHYCHHYRPRLRRRRRRRRRLRHRHEPPAGANGPIPAREPRPAKPCPWHPMESATEPHMDGGRRQPGETFAMGSLSSFDTDDSDILSVSTDGLRRPSSSLRFLVGDMSCPFYFPPWRLFKGSFAPCAYSISQVFVQF